MATLLKLCVTMTLLAPDGVLFNNRSMEKWTSIESGLSTVTVLGPLKGISSSV